MVKCEQAQKIPMPSLDDTAKDNAWQYMYVH